jgi:dephospho-CoA kinase
MIGMECLFLAKVAFSYINNSIDLITVGLTGGIGSGKSTVARVFELLGVPIFYADLEAKLIYNDPEVEKILVDKIGSDVYIKGTINKNRLRSFLFESEENRTFINNLIHPRVALRYKDWKNQQSHPYIVREAAILIESGSYKDCDQIILIAAPEKVRISRVMKRDGLTEEEVIKRIRAQWTDEERSTYATQVWTNDNRSSLLEKILLFDNAIKV